MNENDHPELDEPWRLYELKAEKIYDDLAGALGEFLEGERIPLDIVNTETGETLHPANRKITKRILRKLASNFDLLDLDQSPIRNKIRETILPFHEQLKEAYADFDKERIHLLENTPDHASLIDLMKRSDAGEAEAQYELGNRYFVGWVYGTDHKRAKSLLLKAAEQGHARAQVALGDCCGVSEEGVKWYKKAAGQGSVEPYVKLGDCYYYGWGTGTANYPQAGLWYWKAAKTNNPEAQYKLAKLCDEHKGYVGKHIFPDANLDASILMLYCQAAAQGHPEALIQLGLAWARGRKAWYDNDEVHLGEYALNPEKWEESSEPDVDHETIERREDHDFHGEFCCHCGRTTRAVDRFGLWCEWQWGKSYEENTSEEERELAAVEDKAQELRCYYEASVENGESGEVEAEQLGEVYAEMGDEKRAGNWFGKARPSETAPLTAINCIEMPVGVSNIGPVLPGEQPLYRYTRLSTLLSLTWERVFVPSLAILRRDDPKEALRLGKQTDEYWLNPPREEYDRLCSKANEYEKEYLSEHEKHPNIWGPVLYRIWQREILNERCAWCWHGAEIESTAMWHQYSQRVGIAIKTTVTRLISALREAKYCALIGKINYSKEVSEDYFCRPYFLKEPCYHHEQEVRVIFPYKPSIGEPGMHLHLKWRDFLDEIVVSPFIPQPEAFMLKAFLTKAFPGVEITVSSIMATSSDSSDLLLDEKFGKVPDRASLNDILSAFT